MTLTRMLTGFSFFKFGAILAPFGRSEPTPSDKHESDIARREILNEMLARDYTLCSNEYGTLALMAMFPRDF